MLVHAGRPDEAAVHGRTVCAVMPWLTSARVHRQLTGLGAALHPYRDATEVAGSSDAELPARQLPYCRLSHETVTAIASSSSSRSRLPNP